MESNGKPILLTEHGVEDNCQIIAVENLPDSLRVKPPAPYLGDRDIVAQIKQRITSMTQLSADTPDHVIWQFAQVCTAHQLNPFTGDAYIIELGSKKNDATGQWEKQYGVHVGVKGLRKMARRQANYQMQARRLSPDEVRQYRRESYDEKDVGYEVTVYRLDVARECKEIGIPYIPVEAVGFWRQKARYDKYDKKWKSDNVPETWTPDQVAEKRAEVSALKKAFDIEIAVGDPSQEDMHVRIVDDMQDRIDTYDRDHALPVEAEIIYEDDGNVLFAPSDPPRAKHTVKIENAPQEPPSAAMWDDDKLPDDAPNPHRWLHAEIEKTFPPDARDEARHWIVELYTSRETPNDVRQSSNDLSDDECIAIVESMQGHRKWWQQTWGDYQSQPS